jgi:hypothetical protein
MSLLRGCRPVVVIGTLRPARCTLTRSTVSRSLLRVTRCEVTTFPLTCVPTGIATFPLIATGRASSAGTAMPGISSAETELNVRMIRIVPAGTVVAHDFCTAAMSNAIAIKNQSVFVLISASLQATVRFAYWTLDVQSFQILSRSAHKSVTAR